MINHSTGEARRLRRFGGISQGAVAALVALIGATTLAACSGSAESDDGTITLTFSSYNYGTAGLGGAGTQTLIDAFEAAHPDIRLEPQAVPVAEVLTATRAAVAAGDPPDVVQIGWSKMAEAYQTLPVVPVETVAGPDWAQAAEGVAPSLLAAGEHEGLVTAMPFTVSTPVVYYNADLFAAAGLDPAAPPTSFAEFEEAAQAIAATGVAGGYLDIANSAKSDFLTQSVLNGAGAALVDEDGNVVFDSPEAVDALSTIAGMTESGAQPAVNTEEATAAFQNGQLGMLVTSTALLAGLEEAASGRFDLRTTGFPTYGDEPARPTYSGAGLVVLSQDPEVQQAAWDFITFVTSAEGSTIITRDIGYLPLRPAIVDDPEYLADYFAEDPRLLPALEQLDTVTPYTSFSGTDANQATVILQDQAIAPIVFQGADPEQTLTEVADQIRELLGQ